MGIEELLLFSTFSTLSLSGIPAYCHFCFVIVESIFKIKFSTLQIKNKIDRLTNRVKGRVDKYFTGAEGGEKWDEEEELMEAIGDRKSINFQTNSSMKGIRHVSAALGGRLQFSFS